MGEPCLILTNRVQDGSWESQSWAARKITASGEKEYLQAEMEWIGIQSGKEYKKYNNSVHNG